MWNEPATGRQKYTKWEVSGNSEIIAVKDHESFAPICYIKPPNWDNAHLIASAPDMYKALKTAVKVCEAHAAEWDDLIPARVWFLDIKRALAKADGLTFPKK